MSGQATGRPPPLAVGPSASITAQLGEGIKPAPAATPAAARRRALKAARSIERGYGPVFVQPGEHVEDHLGLQCSEPPTGLDDAELRYALTFLEEATTSKIRRARIDAIVAALPAAQELTAPVDPPSSGQGREPADGA